MNNWFLVLLQALVLLQLLGFGFLPVYIASKVCTLPGILTSAFFRVGDAIEIFVDLGWDEMMRSHQENASSDIGVIPEIFKQWVYLLHFHKSTWKKDSEAKGLGYTWRYCPWYSTSSPRSRYVLSFYLLYKTSSLYLLLIFEDCFSLMAHLWLFKVLAY